MVQIDKLVEPELIETQDSVPFDMNELLNGLVQLWNKLAVARTKFGSSRVCQAAFSLGKWLLGRKEVRIDLHASLTSVGFKRSLIFQHVNLSKMRP